MEEGIHTASDYIISKDKSLLQFEQISEMLWKTYWAENRPEEIIRESIENSICYSVFYKDIQIGFARVITDYATAYYICDVVINEVHRGKGLGKRLIETIINDSALKSLFGMLITKDAHNLYEQYGFIKDGKIFMYRH